MEARLEYCVCTVVIPYIQALVFERSYGGLPKLSDMTPTSREGLFRIPESGQCCSHACQPVPASITSWAHIIATFLGLVIAIVPMIDYHDYKACSARLSTLIHSCFNLHTRQAVFVPFVHLRLP